MLKDFKEKMNLMREMGKNWKELSGTSRDKEYNIWKTISIG